MSKLKLVNYQLLKKNLNVIVEPSGAINLTKRTKLNKNFKKNKPIKRLHKTWTQGLKQTPSVTKAKSKKEKKNKKDQETPDFNPDGKSLVNTAFVKRIADTKLVNKSEKPKHIEQNYANKPAPKAEKRKRLLVAAKQASNGNVPTLVEADDEERKLKSGGRSKKKVRMNV